MSAAGTSKYLPASSLEGVQNEEVLLKENNTRWVMFPIEHDSFWVMYKEVENNFWAAEDFLFSTDSNHLPNLPTPLLESLKYLLSYHIVLDNTLVCRPADVTLDLLSDVQVAEARAFYGFQLTDENVHTETVCSMFQSLSATLNKNAGADKVSWLLRELSRSKCFFKRVLMTVVSKMVFHCSFVILGDFLHKDKQLPTYTSALYAIRNDLHIHVRFAHCVFRLLEHKMLESEVVELVKEAVNLELDFCSTALPLDFMGLQTDQLKSYIECVADNLLLVCGYKVLFTPEFKVDWLPAPTVDLKIQRHVPKQPPQNQVVNLNDIKFDEDF